MAITNHESPIDVALTHYFERRDQGEKIGLVELRAKFPECAAELEQFFANEQRLNQRLAEISSQSASHQPTLDRPTAKPPSSKSKSSESRLSIRCPNCHQPTQVAADTEFTDLTCQSCGSRFGLIGQENATAGAAPLLTMGRFELVERLGMGAFGTVWKARDKELDRTVAVKIPRQGGMTTEEQEKFLREARAAAQLSHPNIVSVHEVGRDGDSIYIVSDFVRGLTLADWLTGQQPSNREAAELCAKVADALHHAHDKGVVHRDLKPANVMLDGDLAPHIMDFGLARREVGEVTMTVDGHVLGTPAYMSPEQAEGKAHTADRRSDVYSLGVILYQLLTGELPFRGNARMLMHQVIHDEPPSPRKLNANIKRDLETITLKCLEKDPAKRFQTAADFSAELRRFLAGEPIQARPVSRLERGWRWARRKPAIATLSAAVLALIAGTIAVLAISNARVNRESGEKDAARGKLEIALRDKGAALKQAEDATSVAEKERAAAIENEKTAQKNEAAAKKSEEIASRRFYAAQMNLASQAWRDGKLARAVALLESVRPTHEEADLRGFEWRHLYHLCHSNVVRRWNQNGTAINDIVWPEQADWFATTSSLDGVYIWNGATGEREAHLPINRRAAIWDLSVTPDGQLLAAAVTTGEIFVWDVPQQKQISSWMAHPTGESGARAVAISPDKKWIVSGARVNAATILWDIHGNRLSTFYDNTQWIGKVAFTPDGKTLVTASYAWEEPPQKSLKIWSMGDRPTLRHELKNVGAQGLAISPDAKSIWCTDSGSKVIAIDLETASRRESYAVNESGSKAIAEISGKNSFVTGSSDRTIRLWNSEIRESSLIGAETAEVRSVAASASGQRIVSGATDGWITLRDLDRPPGVIKLDTSSGSGKRTDIWHIAYSADGRRLFLGGPTLIQVETAAGQIRNLRMQNVLGFSPDGRFAASHRWQVGKLDIRDLTTNTVLTTLTVGPSINQVAISPDHRFAAVWTHWKEGKGIELWDLQAKKRLPLTMGGNVTAVSFSPASNRLAVGTQSRPLTICNADTQEIMAAEMSPPCAIGAQALVHCYSHDGKVLATGFSNGTIVLWDITDSGKAKLLSQLYGHAYGVNALQFSPDGKQLASAAGDKSIRIWDVGSGQETIALDESAKQLAFGPQGDRLVVVGRNNSVKILATGDLESTLRRRASWRPDESGQLAWLNVTAGKPRKAIELLTPIIESGSADFVTVLMRGEAYLSIGQHAEAVADFEHAYAMNQEDVRLLNNFAWVLATSPDDEVRSGKRAITIATKAAEVCKYRLPYILSTLGAAYAEAGDFENAKKWSKQAMELQQRALDAATNDAQRNLLQTEVNDLRSELKNYEQGKPMRQRDHADDGFANAWLSEAKMPPPAPPKKKSAAEAHSEVLKSLHDGDFHRAVRAAVAADDSTLRMVFETPFDPAWIAAFEPTRFDNYNMLILGELHMVSGNATAAEVELRKSMPNGAAYPHWYYPTLGWCLLAQGKPDDARSAFEQTLEALRKDDGTFELSGADIDQYTAAYFLDVISEPQFRECAELNNSKTCHVWFYIGQRREIEGKPAEAVDAYERCVEQRLRTPHITQAYARWRLIQLDEAKDGESSKATEALAPKQSKDAK